MFKGVKRMKHPFYTYQKEADNAIYHELVTMNQDKCLIKMFCGTGKSLIMHYGKAFKNLPLMVYVFPSLSLITQFYEDYLNDFPKTHILRISSEEESTTDPAIVRRFLVLHLWTFKTPILF
jgi:predicted helicase